MIEVILAVVGLSMSLVVYPVLLLEARRGKNPRLAVTASAVNLAGITITVVTLVVVLAAYLL